MPNEPIEERLRASEAEVENILRTPTPSGAASATLVHLLSALDARRRCREKLVLVEQSRSVKRAEG